MSKEIIIISYYTKDTPYKGVMESYLLPSLKKFKLNYDIEDIENQGNWQKNTHLKAQFIKRKLLEYKKPVVFLDADAEIKQFPKLFFEMNQYDLGLHYLDWSLNWHKQEGKKKKEALSGTLFLNYNDRVLNFLGDWIKENEKSRLWEQKNMQKVLIRYKKELKIFNLPYSYITILDKNNKIPNHMIKEEDVVILHNQMSRKFKKYLSDFRKMGEKCKKKFIS